MGHMAVLPIVYQGLLICCQIANLVLWTKALGPDILGQYTFVMAFVPCFQIVGSLGRGVSVVRELKLSPENFDEISGSFLMLAALVSGALAIVVWSIVLVLPLQTEQRFLFSVIAAGSICHSLALSPLFEALHQHRRGALATPVVETLNLAAVLVLVSLQCFSLFVAGYLLLARWVLTIVIQWTVFLRFVRTLAFCVSLKTMYRLLVGSASQILCLLIWTANFNLTIALVHYRFGSTETSSYGIAMTIALSAMTLNDVLLRVVGPHILGDFGLRPEFIVGIIRYVGGLAGAVALLAYASALIVASAILDPTYQDLLLPLPYLLGAVVTRAFWAVIELYLIRLNNHLMPVCATFTTAVGTTLIGLMTPSSFGSRGFALGMLSSFVVVTVVSFVIARRAYDQSTRATTRR